MNINQAFGLALKEIRNQQHLTQEDFSEVSSRTYISSLERGHKSPTIEKIEQIANVLNVHPVLLMVIAYAHMDKMTNKEITKMLASEHDKITRFYPDYVDTSNKPDKG